MFSFLKIYTWFKTNIKIAKKTALITVNGKRYGSYCFNMLSYMNDFSWNFQILCYGTLRAIGTISVKNAKCSNIKWRFSMILRYFLERKTVYCVTQIILWVITKTGFWSLHTSIKGYIFQLKTVENYVCFKWRFQKSGFRPQNSKKLCFFIK